MAANNVSPAQVKRGHGYYIVKWPNMIADSTGLAYEPPSGYFLESVQAVGDAYDTSGAVDMECSDDDGTTWSALPDNKDGTAISFTADDVKAPLFQAHKYRAKTSANGAAAGVDVTVFAYFRARS